MIWSSRERNRSCSLVSRRSRGRIANPPLHQREQEESRLAIRGNPQNRICKELAIQRPKTGKFDYLGLPNHSTNSIAFESFTDDLYRAGKFHHVRADQVLFLHPNKSARETPRGAPCGS